MLENILLDKIKKNKNIVSIAKVTLKLINNKVTIKIDVKQFIKSISDELK